MSNDERYMQRCLELASNGIGNVAPNPMVGAVIVHDNKIIGEGFHREYGQQHAEVVAIESVIKKGSEKLLSDSTLYVNLEPCVHFGKTPPCCDQIIKNKIPRVIIGSRDPFEEVNGKGIEKLTKAGVEVHSGVLEVDAVELNRRFFTFHLKRRPYIILKYAQSRDGFIAATNPTDENRWITTSIARKLVHKWRSEESAIMVGTNTVRIDNPHLTVREWTGRQPLRIIIDRSLQLSHDLNIFNQSAKTMIVNEIKSESKGHLEFVKMDFSLPVLSELMNLLYARNIQSVLVEGGARLLESFLKTEFVDEIRFLTGKKNLLTGLHAPSPIGILKEEINLDGDNIQVFRVNNINKELSI